MKALYTAHAKVVGGRNGHAETDDKNLVVELASPGAATKKSGAVTNPEQLFACGYAACFGGAIEFVAKQQKLTVSDVEVNSDVTLNQGDDGFSIGVTLNIVVPGIDAATAQKLVQDAHKVCPYSKAIHGNVEVILKVNDEPLARAA